LVMAITIAAAEMAVISALAHNSSVCTSQCSQCCTIDNSCKLLTNSS